MLNFSFKRLQTYSNMSVMTLSTVFCYLAELILTPSSL